MDPFKFEIATEPAMPQLSPRLMQLLDQPIVINGNGQAIALLATFIETMLAIGWVEHTNDWDNHLEVTLLDGSSFETETGYHEILFGDFNTQEQSTALFHNLEITSVGFYMPHPENTPDIDTYKLPIEVYYPIDQILAIRVISE
jgi:hypothetical protein